MDKSSSNEGFVFAASGPDYTSMARCAVRSLRQAMPGANVHLFTDQDVHDTTFDAIWPLEATWFRPKMEALRRSPFERTVFLDADIIVRHDISELFDVLRRFDITGAQMIRTNQGVNVHDSAATAPACFPQINSGVLGVRRSPKTMAMLEEWEQTVRDSAAQFDQPTLRDILWRGELKIHVLPSQYNMMSHRLIRHWDTTIPAPRVLHLGGLGSPFEGDPTRPYNVAALIGHRMLRHIRHLDAADASLGGDPKHYRPSLSSRDVLDFCEDTDKRLRLLRERGKRRLLRLIQPSIS